jgi:hypothetical protein
MEATMVLSRKITKKKSLTPAFAQARHIMSDNLWYWRIAFECLHFNLNNICLLNLYFIKFLT